MTDFLLTTENTTIGVLAELLEAALFELRTDDDGGSITVEDTYRIVVERHGDFVKLTALFLAEPGSTEQERLAFVNRVNDGLVTIRASVHAERTIVFDWFLPLRGGLPRKTVAHAIRTMLALLGSVGRHDDDHVLG